MEDNPPPSLDQQLAALGGGNAADWPENHRAGFVALVGKPNAGKSTLLNAMMGHKLAIVTWKPSTTRHQIRGVLSGDDFQVVFCDTPGVIRPRYKLHERMMGYVRESLTDAELVCWVADGQETLQDDDPVFDTLARTQSPIMLVLNKMDVLPPDEVATIVQTLRAQAERRGIQLREAVVISAQHGLNTELLLGRIQDYLQPSPPYFDREQLTDRPERFFVAEAIREQIFIQFQQEIPYSTEVVITHYEALAERIHIEADIHVARQSQKAILIGRGGAALRTLGTHSRRMLEQMLDQPVFLKLYIRVTEDWKDRDRQLRQFGYEQS